MDDKDKKEIGKIVGQVIDEKVTPRLKRLEEKSDATIEMVAKNSEDVTETKEGMAEVKEEMTDMKYVDERIETKLDSAIRRESDLSVKTSQLSRRVLRLESKKA